MAGRVPVVLLDRVLSRASNSTALIFVRAACSAVGFEIPVIVIVMAPAAIPELGALPNVKDRMPPVRTVATLQPTGKLVQLQLGQAKPVSVMRSSPFFGVLHSGVNTTVIVTPIEYLYAKSSVMVG